MVQVISLPAGTERLVATGDELEPGHIIGRSPDGLDWSVADGGVVVYANADVVVVAGRVYTVTLLTSDMGAEGIDPYAFGTEAEAEDFAKRAQERLGQEGMALDVTVSGVMGLRQMTVDAAVTEFVEGYLYEDEETEVTE